jgi:hypothetical protein
MTPLTEESFRALLDADGVLRSDAPLAPPPRVEAYLVFAQRSDARLETDAWTRNAAQFFDARVGLTADKRYDPSRPAPSRDAARVVVVPASGEPGGTRLCFARPRSEDDLAAAEVAEASAGPAAVAGMVTLARRCGVVWLVVAEGDVPDLDRVALRIAGVVASVVLGPILAPSGGALFGVKTARARLASPRAP